MRNRVLVVPADFAPDNSKGQRRKASFYNIGTFQNHLCNQGIVNPPSNCVHSLFLKIELRTTRGLLPACNVLASPINKKEFIVRLSPKSF